MTTEKAAALYLAQHEYALEHNGLAVFNPDSLPVEDLPAIYGFCNSCSPGWHSAMLMAEDGACLGGHCCSDHGYMPHDLGLLEGTRPDRHETFRKHYPSGYRMVLTDGRSAEVQAAYLLNQERAKQDTDET